MASVWRIDLHEPQCQINRKAFHPLQTNFLLALLPPSLVLSQFARQIPSVADRFHLDGWLFSSHSRKCALSGMSHLCQHRIQLGDKGSYYYISPSSRTRVTITSLSRGSGRMFSPLVVGSLFTSPILFFLIAPDCSRLQLFYVHPLHPAGPGETQRWVIASKSSTFSHLYFFMFFSMNPKNYRDNIDSKKNKNTKYKMLKKREISCIKPFSPLFTASW